MPPATYKDSGVDLETYGESMSRLPRLMHRTFSPRVLEQDGGFAGLFQLDFQSRLFARNYEDPVLVACTDGVGTKLKVAVMTGCHDTVGIDLVAMCVNDAICVGAEPLFFLDYVAMSQDDPELLEQIVDGISQGCLQADCALLGGETAIMPDLYAPGEYDLAGFCVGVVDRKQRIDGKAIVVGDQLIAIASSGFHSNGYSLIRKVVFDSAKLRVSDRPGQLESSVGKQLLQPTWIYTRVVRDVLRKYKVKSVVHGIAHITGGGLFENISRILPKGTGIRIDRDSWPTPACFSWLQSLGDIEPEEMYRVFNMGVGLVLVVSPFYASSILKTVEAAGFDCWDIGRVVEEEGSGWS